MQANTNYTDSIKENLIEHLSQFVFERRFKLFQEVVKHRTRYVTVVLEDIFQSQNASAVLRTCDCMGVQDVHIIENRNRFNVDSEVDMGASKWLTLKRYTQHENNTIQAIGKLRDLGYRIVATTPHSNDCSIKDFDISKGKFALLFGTELTGLSNLALDNADEFIRIPMYGFTESFNISVSVALTLYELTSRLRESNLEFLIDKNEQQQILLDWLRASIRNSNLIEKRFLQDFNKR